MPGIALIFTAVAMQAVANGSLSGNLSGKESLLLSFLAFAAATVVFSGVAGARKGDSTATPLRVALRPLAQLNLATAVTFIGFYWSLSLIPAALAAAIETSIGPLVLACLRYRSMPVRQRTGRVLIGALTLALAVLAAAREVSDGELGSLAVVVLGLAVAAAAGASAATIPVLSFKLGELQVSPARVTAHRFHLTYVVAFVLLAVQGLPASAFDTDRIFFLGLVAVLGSALPLFILQIGMQKTAPMTVAIAGSSIPGLTYVVASALGRQSFDQITFVLISGSLIMAFFGPFLIRVLERPRPLDAVS